MYTILQVGNMTQEEAYLKGQLYLNSRRLPNSLGDLDFYIEKLEAGNLGLRIIWNDLNQQYGITPYEYEYYLIEILRMRIVEFVTHQISEAMSIDFEQYK